MFGAAAGMLEWFYDRPQHHLFSRNEANDAANMPLTLYKK